MCAFKVGSQVVYSISGMSLFSLSFYSQKRKYFMIVEKLFYIKKNLISVYLWEDGGFFIFADGS